MQHGEELLGSYVGLNSRYRLDAPIARGGFGAVYRAWDVSLERNVALKVLMPGLRHDRAFVTRFRREALAVARLRHPHILEIYDFGTDQDGNPYLVMPLVRGGTLRDEFGEAGRQPWLPMRALHLARQLLPALDFAHTQGVIHRDVKPANVLLEGEWSWLADFGIARIALGDETSIGQTLTGANAIGTPEYMAPEQVMADPNSPVDGRADLYACAVVLFELLTGRVPFKGDTTWDTCYQVVHAPLPHPRELNSSIPERVAAVVMQGLAKDRAERHATGADFVAALGAALEPIGVTSVAPAVEAPGAPSVEPRTVRSDAPPVPVALRWDSRLRATANRFVRAIRLEGDVFEEVKRDEHANIDAALIVAAAGIAWAIGSPLLQLRPHTGVDLIAAAAGGLVGAYAGWPIWAFLTWAIGTGVFRGVGKPSQMLRASGFAQSPGVLGLFALVPLLGPLLSGMLVLWLILAAVVSVRQALGIGTVKAITTTFLAGLPALGVQAGVNFGISYLTAAAVGALVQ